MKICRHLMGAFSLVEVTLALGVASFCLVNVFGLLLVGMNSNQTAVQQTAAASLAMGVASDLRTTLSNDASSTVTKHYQIPIPSSGTATHTLFLKEDGTLSGSVDANADPAQAPKYRATVVFTVPPAKTNYYGTISAASSQGKATLVRILISWPALADKMPSAAPVNCAGSYETLTALDRS
ncbi:MAG: hypothetical protein ACFUZC_14510 [Chthoniobacteraceae bacterium]